MADKKIHTNNDPAPGIRPDGTLAECSEDYEEEEVEEKKPASDRARRSPRIVIHRS